jgi:hypothetical protein
MTVHLADGSRHGVYEYRQGEPTLLAAGMLIQSLRIAASAHGRSIGWHHENAEGRDLLAVTFKRTAGQSVDPLLAYLSLRSVDRRPFRLRPLDPGQKNALAEALGDGFSLDWQETWSARWQAARLNALATDIRLRSREAFDVHRDLIDWQQNFSPWGIPGGALGLDPATQLLTRWLLQKWWRINTLNHLGGTALARLEMDLIPGIFCAAHFNVRAQTRPTATNRVAFLLGAGQAVQRFWLTATRLGLAVQPGLGPFCFALPDDGTGSGGFSGNRAAMKKAARLSAGLEREATGETSYAVFRGRIGTPSSGLVKARSVRRPLSSLIDEKRSA